MLKPNEPTDDDFDPIAPACRATVSAVQLVLDGDSSADVFETDPHAAACETCRERVRAARVLLAVLAIPSEPVPVPADFTNKVMAGVWDAWHARRRERVRRVYKAGAALALAAAVLITAFAIFEKPQSSFHPEHGMWVGPHEVAQQPEAAPAPREKEPAPEPRPMRISDEVAKAGQVFRDPPKPLADSVAVAPKLYDAFASAFRAPAEPVVPMGDVLEPTRKSLAELPDAARHGLEPVTDTAQKAFDRLLRDVASVKPKS